VRGRLLILFCAMDHMILAIFTLGNCNPFEQISGALWALDQDGKFFGILRRPVDFCLSWLEADHCRKVWELEQRQIILIGKR